MCPRRLEAVIAPKCGVFATDIVPVLISAKQKKRGGITWESFKTFQFVQQQLKMQNKATKEELWFK